MTITDCKHCGRAILKIHDGLTLIAVDEEPNPQRGHISRGQDGIARFLDGTDLAAARAAGVPLYTRHGVTCPNPWGRKDLKINA